MLMGSNVALIQVLLAEEDSHVGIRPAELHLLTTDRDAAKTQAFLPGFSSVLISREQSTELVKTDIEECGCLTVSTLEARQFLDLASLDDYRLLHSTDNIYRLESDVNIKSFLTTGK